MELFWLNLVTDVLPALGLATAEPAGDVMTRAPVPLKTPILGRAEFATLGIDAAQMAGAALAAHFAMRRGAAPGPQMRAATLVTLAGAQFAYAFGLRDRSGADPAGRAISVRRLESALAASTALLVLPLVVPPLGRIIGISRLAPGQLGLCAALAGGSLLLSEARRAAPRLRRAA